MPSYRIMTYPVPIPYAVGLTEQSTLAEQRRCGEIPDTLMLLEHPPTITLGRRTNESDLLTTQDELALRGITVERVDRGGEITYHGPGQLVGYPILDLRDHGQDLHQYLRDLEEALIVTLAEFGVLGKRMTGRTGVWVNDKKIAAMGIKVARWITTHGFALNITTDLTPFRNDFVPCGITDRDVTSMGEQLGTNCPSRADVEAVLVTKFIKLFFANT